LAILKGSIMLLGFEFECYMPEQFYYKKDFLKSYKTFLSKHDFPIERLGKVGYVYDSSLKAEKKIQNQTYYGKEIITSALEKNLAIQLMLLTFQYFKETNIKTYQDCGLHLNVNLESKKENKKIDYLRFLAILQQENWLKYFKRENCLHCPSTEKVLSQDKHMWIDEATYDIQSESVKEQAIDYLFEHTFNELIYDETTFDKSTHEQLCQSLYEYLVGVDKHHIIVEKFTDTNRYFELRMVGGNKYHFKKNTILHLIQEAEDALLIA
jgi:hypothetical protein